MRGARRCAAACSDRSGDGDGDGLLAIGLIPLCARDLWYTIVCFLHEPSARCCMYLDLCCLMLYSVAIRNTPCFYIQPLFGGPQYELIKLARHMGA